MTFNLKDALARAEAGEAGQWEAIARHFLAKQAAPKKTRASKADGPQTWAHVVLEDGREYLTSAYARADHAHTVAAHGDYAQFRARMEDSGDRSNYGQTAKADKYGNRYVSRAEFDARAFLDRSIPAVPVKSVTLLDQPESIERVRDHCFMQRGQRQGWWPTLAAIVASEAAE